MSPRRPPLAMRPQGAPGRAFGVLMEALNNGAYRFALDLAALESASDVLEIGFGTGRMLELMADAPPAAPSGSTRLRRWFRWREHVWLASACGPA